MVKAYKISSEYVGEDCVQLMFKFSKNLEIVGNGKIIFYGNYNDGRLCNHINEYVKDDRRFQFPYSNIPMHTKMIGLKKYVVVNQLLDYDKIYNLIVREENHSDLVNYADENCTMLYYKVLKDNNESLLIVSNYKMNYAFCMNINEIKHLHINSLKESRISRFINNGISRNDLDIA